MKTCMKHLAFIGAIALPGHGLAYQDMASTMADTMIEMQNCLQAIPMNEKKMEKMRQRVEKIGEEIRALCHQNKRSAASAKAKEMAQMMKSSEEMKQFHQCTSKAIERMPMLRDRMRNYVDLKTGKHVCDQ